MKKDWNVLVVLIRCRSPVVADGPIDNALPEASQKVREPLCVCREGELLQRPQEVAIEN